MFRLNVLSIPVLIVCVVSLVKSFQSIREYMNYTIPNQLLELVKQAHFGKEYQTLWNIEVSEEMRNALLAPLSAQQVLAYSRLKEDKASTWIDGVVVSHKLKTGELSGIVCFSIEVRSSSGHCIYSNPETRLRITVSHVGRLWDDQWIVTSVERLEES